MKILTSKCCLPGSLKHISTHVIWAPKLSKCGLLPWEPGSLRHTPVMWEPKMSACVLSPWDQGSLKHINTSCHVRITESNPVWVLTCSLKNETLSWPWGSSNTISSTKLFWPSLDYIFPISHPVANSAERGLAQRSFNQSACSAVSGKWDDNLLFFSPSLIMITSFSLSLSLSDCLCDYLCLPLSFCSCLTPSLFCLPVFFSPSSILSQSLPLCIFH